MQTNFLAVYLAGFMVSLVASPGLAFPSPSSVDSNREADPPICFMKTSNGAMLNLTNLCGSGSANPVTPIATATLPKRTLSDTGLQARDFYDMGRSGQMQGFDPNRKK